MGAIVLAVWTFIRSGFVKLLAAAAKVPWKVWAVLGALLLVFLLYRAHVHQVHEAYANGHNDGYAQRADEDAQALAKFTARANEIAVQAQDISKKIKEKNDAEAAATRAHGDSLSVRGPGKARAKLVEPPAVPTAASQPEPGAGESGAPATGVPADNRTDDIAGVSWRWLVGTGTQCDLDAAEVRDWHGWYLKQSANWERLRQPVK